MPTVNANNSFMLTEGEITVTFDPEYVGYVTDIAKELGVEAGSARSWVNRRLKLRDSRIPAPLFTLPVKGENFLHVWKMEDIAIIVAEYRKARELRAASM